MPDEIPEFLDPAEDCPWRSPREILARHGYTPPPLSELNDFQLKGRLWELLYAAAGRRLFFHATDHLSDWQLYRLLQEKWLDEPTADIPLDAETNTNTIISEFSADGLSSEEIFLRYYADDDDLELWQTTIADLHMPVREAPPFDRDRFLPVAPIPFHPPADLSPDEDTFAEDDQEDPLGLASVDREIAANREEAAEFLSPATSDPEVEARKRENWISPARKLRELRLPLLPPDEVTDETLLPILWELLHNLAQLGFYLRHSDHLSDRELYVTLWKDALRRPAYLPGRNPRGAWFHDFLVKWGDAERQLWLRFHATEAERARHAAEWARSPIPPKEEPVWRRDWRLPQAPFCW